MKARKVEVIKGNVGDMGVLKAAQYETEPLDVQLSVKLAQSEAQALDDAAWKNRLRRSELVRHFIQQGLESIGEDAGLNC